MKRILFLCLLILLVTLACSVTGISVPASIPTMPTMDLNRISTLVVETAQALATASTATRISPTDTLIVITATSTTTDTASPTITPSLTATPTTFTLSPTSTSIPLTNTAVKKAATNSPVATPTYIQPTATNVSPATVPLPVATAIPPTAVPPTVESICPVTNASYEARVIDLINAERANAGLSALSPQGQLGSAAQLHSVDMACNNYFSHTGLDGSNSGERAQRQGYGSSYVGENIAAGYSSPESVVQGWMNSPGHKANILGADYTEIGVGYAFGDNSDYGAYWTAVFASP